MKLKSIETIKTDTTWELKLFGDRLVYIEYFPDHLPAKYMKSIVVIPPWYSYVIVLLVVFGFIDYKGENEILYVSTIVATFILSCMLAFIVSGWLKLKEEKNKFIKQIIFFMIVAFFAGINHLSNIFEQSVQREMRNEYARDSAQAVIYQNRRDSVLRDEYNKGYIQGFTKGADSVLKIDSLSKR